VTRGPGKISHLLPMNSSSSHHDAPHETCKDPDSISIAEDSTSFIAWQQQKNSKRASI
jgi:hypothetical protein